MQSLKVLDVTLRDGGCVNNFNFGHVYMKKILAAQEAANIDIIELGYIDDKKGSLFDRTQYLNEDVIKQCILKEKKEDILYVAMIDYGKYNFNNLKHRTSDGIDGIRLAFHKENCHDIINIGKIIIEKGYKLFLQPMATLRYSDCELIDLIDRVNRELPETFCFYMVDSFGEMRPNDIIRIMNLIDHNLKISISFGFHSHNNLQLSYSNAMTIMQFPTTRSLIIDSSIMGMGKGAGNLNTELLIEHLNLFYGKEYIVPPLLDVIDKVINQLHEEFYWGYAPEYYLSAINHCSPSYASYYYSKHMLPIDQIGEMLALLADEKKVSFDKAYAEKIYRCYNEENYVDDKLTVNELKSIFLGKKVLLIAPGKSIIKYHDIINKMIEKDDCLSIGLNLINEFNFNYLLTTRVEVYNYALDENKRIIAPSNISKEKKENVKVLNYKDWIIEDEGTYDSSSVIALNLLKACKVKEVFLAGFDGFSSNINDNYYDPYLRHNLTSEQAEKTNCFYKKFINDIRESGIPITFITHSKYE